MVYDAIRQMLFKPFFEVSVWKFTSHNITLATITGQYFGINNLTDINGYSYHNTIEGYVTPPLPCTVHRHSYVCRIFIKHNSFTCCSLHRYFSHIFSSIFYMVGNFVIVHDSHWRGIFISPQYFSRPL